MTGSVDPRQSLVNQINGVLRGYNRSAGEGVVTGSTGKAINIGEVHFQHRAVADQERPDRVIVLIDAAGAKNKTEAENVASLLNSRGLEATIETNRKRG